MKNHTTRVVYVRAINGTFSIGFSTFKKNYKPIKMLDKLKELNNNLNAWILKKQGSLTKGQHLIVILMCFLFLGLSVGRLEEGEEKTIFNYWIPFASCITIGGTFSFGAIVEKKYKKKKIK